MSLTQQSAKRLIYPSARWWLAPVLPALLLGVWYAMTRGTATKLPTPSNVFEAATELVRTGELLAAVETSIGRVLCGFALGTLTACLLGVLMGRWRLVREVFDPLIETVRPIAAIALVPIAILWFGNGTSAAVFIVSYAAFFPMVVNTVAGVRGVDRGVLEAAQTFGLGELAILEQVIFPAALPSLLVGARLSMGLAWTSVIAAELAVGAKAGGGESGGIGQLMFT